VSKEAQLLKVLKEAEAQAGKVRDEVMWPLWKANFEILLLYEDTKTKAQEAYNEAVAPAMKAYYEAHFEAIFQAAKASTEVEGLR